MARSKTSWAPGQSGNPAGRARSELRAALDEHGPAVVARVVELALAGDVQAARLVLERVLPALKPTSQTVNVELPDGTLTQQAQALVQAAASGALAPDVASELLAALARVAGIEVADDMRKRLDQLEHGDLA